MLLLSCLLQDFTCLSHSLYEVSYPAPDFAEYFDKRTCVTGIVFEGHETLPHGFESSQDTFEGTQGGVGNGKDPSIP